MNENLGYIDQSAICERCGEFRAKHWGAAHELCHMQGEPGEYPIFVEPDYDKLYGWARPKEDSGIVWSGWKADRWKFDRTRRTFDVR